MAEITLEGISKRFGGIEACTDIDLRIEEGEFFVLLGPSGCGKTTTLRIISGLEEPSEGTIYFDDTDVTDQEPAERDVAMVFQNYALYPHMSVYDNIAFPLRLHNRDYSEDEIERLVLNAAEMLQITDQLEKSPEDLSGGQQQRVALGRSIVREPSVFLMDEPLSNLDMKLRIAMRSELQELHDKLGITTIYVTHNQTEAMSLADRIALLNDGRVQQIGEPREVFEEPANEWVASFIGSPPMNILTCSHESRNGEDYLTADGFEFEVTDEEARRALSNSNSKSLKLGFRPKDVELHSAVDSDAIEVEIATIEPTGERTIMTMLVDSSDEEVKLETENRFFDAYQKGDRVAIRPSKFYLFDERGERVAIAGEARTGGGEQVPSES